MALSNKFLKKVFYRNLFFVNSFKPSINLIYLRFDAKSLEKKDLPVLALASMSRPSRINGIAVSFFELLVRKLLR